MIAARKGIRFVIAAPSGTGKTTVCRRVVEADALIEFSVSHTTRTPRAREREGVHYHFVAREDFEKLAEEGAFLEWAEYNGNLYGTSWRSVEEPPHGAGGGSRSSDSRARSQLGASSSERSNQMRADSNRPWEAWISPASWAQAA